MRLLSGLQPERTKFSDIAIIILRLNKQKTFFSNFDFCLRATMLSAMLKHSA
jgi:hypothetical protein